MEPSAQSNKATLERNNVTIEEVRSLSPNERDRIALARIGKKQVLRRNFDFLSMFGLSCTILVTWEGITLLFGTGLVNGGPIGLIGQYFLVWIGTACVFTSIGELASLAPTAGGQYHWVAMLAPRSMRNFASYLTGWMTVFAWVTGVTTGAFLCGSLVSSMVFINVPEYAEAYMPWHLTLITWGIMLVAVLFNTVIGNFLPQIEGAFLILHILGFFGVLIPLTYYQPKTDPSIVFNAIAGYRNDGGWPTYGVSFMVGILGVAFSFVGSDAAVHLSEEISDAAINVPRSIFISIIVNGSMGFAMLLALLFALGDQTAALESQQQLGFAFIGVFLTVTQSVGGTTAVIAVVLVLGVSATVGFLATCSRMVWAFARDNGLPFSSILSKVTEKSKIPVPAVILSAIIPCLLVLINIGSTVVFYQVTSLALVGLYFSYFTCCALLLYHRLKGTIQPRTSPDSMTIAYGEKGRSEYAICWGPWHVPGVWGIIVNVIALCYLVVIWIFAFFPPATPVTPATMNYACVVFGAVVLYSIFYYLVWGRRQYKGPIVEIRIEE